jgi:hypothetical protein
MKALIAVAAFIISGSVFAQAAEDPVAVYVAKARLAYRVANVDRTEVQSVQPYYDAAMAAAKNADERKAIALHWAAVKSCVSQSGRQYGEDYADQRARLQPCEDKMANRAAEIEAAGYGS